MIPYPAYKSTNLSWLPKIPEHWGIVRCKQIFRPIDVRSEKGEEQLLSVSERYGVVKREQANVTMFKAASYEGYKLCWPDDLAINSLWAWSYGLGFSPYHGIISTAYSVFRLKDKTKYLPRFYDYLVRSKDFHWELRVRSKGLWKSRYQLSDDAFLAAPILDVPIAEQEQIVRYLDSMTAKINKLIRAKKKQIALLQEQRQAIINHAVTKGLDPNVEMKDSGIDWIGEIPKHWNICKVKHLCRMQAGDNLTAEVIQETGEYPVYGANGRRGFYHAYNLNNDCLLVGRQGALCGNVHIVSGKIWATDHAVITVPTKRAQVSHLYYLLIAMNLNQYALETAAQPGLSVSVIQNLPTLLVPFDEQKAIASFLDKQSAVLDACIDKMKATIDVLNEYKNSLISSIVTGQTDVRNIPVVEVIPDDLISEDVPASEIEEEPPTNDESEE